MGSGAGGAGGQRRRVGVTRSRLSGPALEDIATALAEGAARFGDAASERCERWIATALVELAAKPERPGSRAAPELADGARMYHPCRSKRRNKHRAGTAAGTVGSPATSRLIG